MPGRVPSRLHTPIPALRARRCAPPLPKEALNKSIQDLSEHAEFGTRPNSASQIKHVQLMRAWFAGGTSLCRMETLINQSFHKGEGLK